MTTLFETPRLIIKAPQPEDLPGYIELHMHPDVKKLMYTQAKDAAQIQQWLDDSMAHYEQHKFCDGSVFEKATGHFIGRAGLNSITKEIAKIEAVEVDCYLLPAYWQQQYGVELLRGCFDWGFNQFAMKRIIATVYPINIPARKLAEKAGMQYIGNHMYRGTELLWFDIANPCT